MVFGDGEDSEQGGVVPASVKPEVAPGLALENGQVAVAHCKFILALLENVNADPNHALSEKHHDACRARMIDTLDRLSNIRSSYSTKGAQGKLSQTMDVAPKTKKLA